jgi:hypothetical protein
VPPHAVVVSLTCEADNAELVTAAHQLHTPVILIWDNLSHPHQPAHARLN